LGQVDHAFAPGTDGRNIQLIAGGHKAFAAQDVAGYDHKSSRGKRTLLKETAAGRLIGSIGSLFHKMRFA
jgi:hypothetical protein